MHTIQSIGFIVTETRNGSGSVTNAFWCASDADFISRISELASRGDDLIETVEQAISYLDERYAQRTEILTKAEFDAQGAEAFGLKVLKIAERAGWYEEPSEDEAE